MTIEHYSDYDPFAWLYNRHWQGQFHPTALAVMDSIFLPRLLERARILDLCCGPGWLASTLSQRGYRITGIDGSKEMLSYARENAPGIEFVLDDARSFEIDARFDGAISVFDSLNHVLSTKDLGSAFYHVFHSLRAEGLFFFDLNTEAGFLQHWHGTYGFVEDDHVCILQQQFDDNAKIAEIEATLFRLEEGWLRSDFTLRQKAYTESEVRKALEDVGFQHTETYGFSIAEGVHPLRTESTRAFFLCRKP